jgi:tetratricopeptide (TPR) repeat protein
MMMKAWLCALLWSSPLLAADQGQLALALKAQTDFDRVALAAQPQLSDTALCMQSQAAILSVSPPEELALLHYRMGYCQLAAGAITHANRDSLSAAAEFDKAIESWPVSTYKGGKNQPPQPVSSGLRVLAWLARVQGWTDDAVRGRARLEIASALVSPSCTANLMSPDFCRQLLSTGRQWLGWMALLQNDIDAAAKNFAGSDESGWPAWVAARKQFEDGKYREAVAQYSRAIEIWKSVWREPGPSFLRRLGPKPNLYTALADLGGAQLLAGDTKSAIASLDAAIQADPLSARDFYLRARAKEVAGLGEQAIADYNLASRTAFANAKDMVSGEAHLYRGILLYLRKDFVRAEDEFASAVNFAIADNLRSDATAWRHLAAVAGGSCAAGREYLERSLAAVSPYFPKQEARAAAASCATAGVLGAGNSAK